MLYDFVFAKNSGRMIEEFKNNMVNKYEMSDMKILKYCLSIECHLIYFSKELCG